MKWVPIFLQRRFFGFLFCFLFTTSLIISSGCATQEQIREATQQTALNTKALLDIEAKKHPENKGIKEVIAALEKGLDGIQKPEPFEIPDWVKIAAGIFGFLLFPSAANHTLNAGKKGMGLVGKILSAISNGKGKGKS